LLQAGKIRIAHAEKTLDLPPRTTLALLADELIGHFTDITYAYRFGPPKHDVVVARLRCAETGDIISEDFYFPLGLALPFHETAQVDASAAFDDAGNVSVSLRSDRFLQSVQISAAGFTPSENYFHCAPDQTKHIVLKSIKPLPKCKLHLSALNLRETVTLRTERSD
jgi:beta-mannosidase